MAPSTSMQQVSPYNVFSGLLLLALANIKREKLRTGLLVITVALSTLLFLTAVGSLNGLKRPISDMLIQQNASHALLEFDNRIYNADTLSAWWQSQPEVSGTTVTVPYVTTSSRPIFQGREMGSFLKLTERPATPMLQDRLKFLEGVETVTPGSGEIWLPSSAARSAGIHAGDYLEIPTEQGVRRYTVSAIVVDPQYSSGFINPVRAWVAAGALTNLFAPSSLNGYMFGVRVNDVADLPKLRQRFNERVGGGFSGNYLSYDRIVASYSQTVMLMGVLVLIFASISLLVAMFIISTTISGEVLAGYRTFGILKSLGYTPRNVVATFQFQFLLISLAAIPIGILGSYFATDTMIGLMLQSLGSAGSQNGFLSAALATSVFIILLVIIVAGVVGGKAGKIKPASAIRYGAPEESVKQRLSIHLRLARFLPLSLVLALKNLASGKKRETYDFLAITVTAFILFFSVNVYYSMSVMDRNLPFWGLDDADVRIKRDMSPIFGLSYDSLKNYLLEDKSVAMIAGQSRLNALVPATAQQDVREISGFVVDGSLDEIGYINLTGRSPENESEVSLGVALAEQYGVKPGDEFTLVIKGKPLNFLVVGVFQGTDNGGYFYRAQVNAVRRADPNFEPENILVRLTAEADRQSFMLKLESQLGQAVSAEPAEKLVESQLQQVVQGLGLVLGFISFILVLVASVSIFNSTAMGINESKRQLGVFKALGYSQNQIRQMVVFKIVLLGVFALLFGLTVFFMGSGYIMDLMMGEIGMANFPLQVSFLGSIFVVPGILLLCVISAWIPSNSIARIQPRTLIVE